MGIVYLLRVDNGDEFLYKIGITKYTAEKRIKGGLQTGNGNEITVINTFETKYNNKIENSLHRMFGTNRKKGEWFNLDIETVKGFIDKCQTLHDNFIYLEKMKNPFI
mgnify:FL=1|tara:strand:- start:22910 stop:23230 length:321 start_codon:yes stop_codon:yes gene_type:complete